MITYQFRGKTQCILYMHFSESINKKNTGRKLPSKTIQHVGRTEICSTWYASELISTYCPEILLDLKAFKQNSDFFYVSWQEFSGAKQGARLPGKHICCLLGDKLQRGKSKPHHLP